MTDIIFKKDELENLIHKLKGWKEDGIHPIDLLTTTMFLEQKLEGNI